MMLTTKLLGFLHRIFSQDPAPFLAFRIGYDGGMTWEIADGAFSTTVTGGTGQNLSLILADYTVSTLASHIASQTGYSVAAVDGTELVYLSASVLLDGSGDIGVVNGDRIFGYTNWLYSYVDSTGIELVEARLQVANAIAQMTVPTASENWLDEQGSYFGVLRLQGESDAAYRVRIIQRILRPIANNVAIQEILKEFNSSLPVWVTNYDTLVNNSYGQFDIDFYLSLADLEETGFIGIVDKVVETVEDVRDAGTFLRALHVITAPVNPFYFSSCTFCGETVTVHPL